MNNGGGGGGEGLVYGMKAKGISINRASTRSYNKR
jgi:hypothetical protein